MNVVIAESDVLTPYGDGVDALWNGLLSRRTAIRSSTRFAERGFVSDQIAMIPSLEVRPGESRVMAMLRRLLAPLAEKLDPQTPLILATTVGEIESIEQAVLGDAPALIAHANPQVLLKKIKALLGLRGRAWVASSACASSALALAQAASIVRRGEADAVLVVACDAISEFVYSGFSTLASLDPAPARPFAADRCGLSLGEAAAWALVAPASSLRATKDSTAILGWASTTDAIHMTAPDRNAAGLKRAIHRACAMATIDPGRIGFIAAHGTATIYSDAMELTAFRAAIAKPIPIFSIKGGIGHTLGAAGLAQIIVAGRAIARQIVPPAVGCAQPDENAAGWVHDKSISLKADSIALSTNSGFGGVNTAIVLGPNRESPAPRSSAPPAPAPMHKASAIQAVAWINATDCGAVSADDSSWKASSPAIDCIEDMARLIDRPMKYFGRMTPATRLAVAAASIAIRAAGWNAADDFSIGTIAAGYDNWLSANVDYFRDYVAAGRTLSRGNLFIYTLPTSAPSEVAIALSLTGPTAHLHADALPVDALLRHGKTLVANNEADGMIALFGDAHACVCFAIDDKASGIDLRDLDLAQEPAGISAALAKKAQRI